MAAPPKVVARKEQDMISKAKDFAYVYRLYRNGGHNRLYSLKTAWNIGVRGWDF